MTGRLTAVCAWCDRAFRYTRLHAGRPRVYCSPACARSMVNARRRATEHYLGARVRIVCPERVRCWVCTGDHCDGGRLGEQTGMAV